MIKEPREDMTMEAPLASLERTLIAQFVRAQGLDPVSLARLSKAERARVLAEASIYASAKLTEVESRAQFVHDIHDVARSAR